MYNTLKRKMKIIYYKNILFENKFNIKKTWSILKQAIGKLEELAQKKPVIIFEEFSDTTIGKATFDSLRMTTAKEFIFDGEDFEKDLLLSQLKVLRLISHLAAQLEKVEHDEKRKLWLSKLSKQYEKYYQQVNMRISIKT